VVASIRIFIIAEEMAKFVFYNFSEEGNKKDKIGAISRP